MGRENVGSSETDYTVENLSLESALSEVREPLEMALKFPKDIGTEFSDWRNMVELPVALVLQQQLCMAVNRIDASTRSSSIREDSGSVRCGQRVSYNQFERAMGVLEQIEKLFKDNGGICDKKELNALKRVRGAYGVIKRRVREYRPDLAGYFDERGQGP